MSIENQKTFKKSFTTKHTATDTPVVLAVFTNDAAGVDIATETFTRVKHGLKNRQRVWVNSGGTLPNGLVAATSYYVKVLTEDTFQLFDERALSTIVAVSDVGAGTTNVTTVNDITNADIRIGIEDDITGRDFLFTFQVRKAGADVTSDVVAAFDVVDGELVIDTFTSFADGDVVIVGGTLV